MPENEILWIIYNWPESKYSFFYGMLTQFYASTYKNKQWHQIQRRTTEKNDNKIKQKETEWKTISWVSFFRWLMPEFCATFCYSRIYSFLMLFLRFVTVYFQEQHWICLTYEAKMEHSTVNCWTSQFFLCCFFSSFTKFVSDFFFTKFVSHHIKRPFEQKYHVRSKSKATKQITFDI